MEKYALCKYVPKIPKKILSFPIDVPFFQITEIFCCCSTKTPSFLRILTSSGINYQPLL